MLLNNAYWKAVPGACSGYRFSRWAMRSVGYSFGLGHEGFGILHGDVGGNRYGLMGRR